ncbi:MAG: 50S ribosomal protein L15e [Candidatus Woesearchaeota archaeon]|nr:MAG: 50S ribosomal protein L15e [Candidatus Woesearchaeota archaeon]
MGYIKYVREAFRKPSEEVSALQRERLIGMRREPATLRLMRPTKIDRARSLGYRAKQGILVVRQRVMRGGRQREKFKSGRRSAHYGRNKVVAINYQRVCEERANKKHPNCEVLNSYYLAKDGIYIWYEVLLLDRAHPQVQADKTLLGVASQRGRVKRGLTSAGKKSRGLRNKGQGAEKLRPSLNAHKGRH